MKIPLETCLDGNELAFIENSGYDIFRSGKCRRDLSDNVKSCTDREIYLQNIQKLILMEADATL